MHPLQRSGHAILRYEAPPRVEAVLAALQSHGPRARLLAGGTDLLLELARRKRTGVDVLIDISRIPGLANIHRAPGGAFRIGPQVTYAQIVRSPQLVRDALPLAQACLEVGSPQIRNCGTVAGALVTARPGGDVAPALIALGAHLVLRSATGVRTTSAADFLRDGGPAPGEMLTEISVPAMATSDRGIFVKSRARRGQAIAIANLAMVLGFDGNGEVSAARIVFGTRGPLPAESSAAHEILLGKPLGAAVIAAASERILEELTAADGDRPDDVHHRKHMLAVMFRRGLAALRDDRHRALWPASPVTLSRQDPVSAERTQEEASLVHEDSDEIEAWVNGNPISAPLAGRFTLLAWLRESVGLTGTKEGCGEGVCGSCTVELDGKAVLACLVPAARVRGARIRTVEGLASAEGPHALQQAFVDQGAVQCGFCTPGFLMAGAALLDEHASPSGLEIEEAFSGNLCRCTGYYAIRRAVEQTAADRDARKIDGDRTI